jgi:hypothetical protein
MMVMHPIQTLLTSTDEPLRVYVISLQDLVDGYEPELIAVRHRRYGDQETRI